MKEHEVEASFVNSKMKIALQAARQGFDNTCLLANYYSHLTQLDLDQLFKTQPHFKGLFYILVLQDKCEKLNYIEANRILEQLEKLTFKNNLIAQAFYYTAGAIKYKVKQYEKADEYLSKGLKLDSSYSACHLLSLKALVQYELGHWETAKELAEEALKDYGIKAPAVLLTLKDKLSI